MKTFSPQLEVMRGSILTLFKMTLLVILMYSSIKHVSKIVQIFVRQIQLFNQGFYDAVEEGKHCHVFDLDFALDVHVRAIFIK